MIRVVVNDTFPIAVSLEDSSGTMISGETVYFDIRRTDDTELSPPNSGILTESTVASGVYKSTVSINETGSFICYIKTDNYGTQTKDILVDPMPVADAVWSTSTATNLLSDVEFIRDVEGGRWYINNNQLILFKEDNITEIARFNLYDKDSNPADTNVFERVRV